MLGRGSRSIVIFMLGLAFGMLSLFGGFDVGSWFKVDSDIHVGPYFWVGLMIGSEAQIYNEAYASFHRPSGLPEN